MRVMTECPTPARSIGSLRPTQNYRKMENRNGYNCSRASSGTKPGFVTDQSTAVTLSLISKIVQIPFKRSSANKNALASIQAMIGTFQTSDRFGHIYPYTSIMSAGTDMPGMQSAYALPAFR